MSRIAFASLLIAGSSFIATAAAQAAPADQIRRLCAGRDPGSPIERPELAAAVLAEEMSLAELLPGTATGNAREAVYSHALQVIQRPGDFMDPQRAGRVRHAREALARALRSGSLREQVTVTGAGSNLTGDQLFEPGQQISLACASERDSDGNDASRPRRIALRKTVDELSLADSSVADAGSATVGFTRSRVRDENAGTTTTNTTFTVNGALGVLLTPPVAGRNPIYVYGEYSRNRQRTRIRPPPADPGEQGQKDVHALDLGVVLSILGGDDFQLRSRVGTVFDFERDSRRFVGNAQIEPTLGGSDIGLCRFGRYSDSFGSGSFRFRTRCRIWGEIDASHVFRAGTAQFGDNDELLAIGGVARFEVALAPNATSGPVASAQWRRLETISGTAPDVSRIELEAGWRWRVGTAALDVKATYVRGEERKTFEDQDILTLGFGLRF